MMFLLCCDLHDETETPAPLPCEGWEPMDPGTDYETLDELIDTACDEVEDFDGDDDVDFDYERAASCRELRSRW